MANAKQNRRPRQRREPLPKDMPSGTARVITQLLPLLRCPNLPGRRSAQHLRLAAIEVLEAMRALLDDTIQWLQREEKKSPELKRIRIEG